MLHLVLITSLLVAVPAVLVADEPSQLPTSPPPAFHEWQVWDTKTDQTVAFDDWVSVLATADVIYLGEEHRNRSHVEAAARILDALIAQGHKPALFLEMFSWDGQEGLDRYLSGKPTTREQFLKESLWEQSWGGPFEDYEPLVTLARTRHFAVLALNPPRALVRQVAKQGLAKALPDPDMTRWGMQAEQFVDDPAYRDTIVSQLRQCHGDMPEDGYQRMYEASMFRDEGMAKVIANSLSLISAVKKADPQTGPIVSYTGGGHIQYRVPVPNRVQRRNGSAKQVTIYLSAYAPSLAGELRELIKGGIADYVWLTPLGAHGLPRRCK